MVNRPDGVLRADDLRELFAELETARRRRQDYQKADRETYHSEPHNVPLHICILPNEKDESLAFQKEAAVRGHYAGRKEE